MLKTILGVFFILLIINACGLPATSDLEDLEAPSGLVVTIICSGSTPAGFSVEFWGFNSEYDFSGYNLYVIQYDNDKPLYCGDTYSDCVYSNLTAQITNHLGTLKTTVESGNIIRYGDNETWPTLNKEFLAAGGFNYTGQPTKITFTVGNDWAPAAMIPEDPSNTFLVNKYYGFGVTAYAASSVSTGGQAETVISNVQLVPYTCP